jgi:hypothetical protein
MNFDEIRFLNILRPLFGRCGNASAISLAPWLQPGGPRMSFFRSTVSKVFCGKPLKRLMTIEITSRTPG